MNYKICLRHMRENDNVFMFWAPNSSGYVKCTEAAGLYHNSENNSKDELIAYVKFYIDKHNWKKGQSVKDFKKIIDCANFAIGVLKGEK